MKIAIVNTGRSHLLNTAINLLREGHEVTYFTCIPTSRCKNFGLPAKHVRSLFWGLGFLFVYRKFAKIPFLRNRILSLLDFLFDFIVSFRIKNYDACIGGSTLAVRCLAQAKRNGILAVCDCGTKHVLAQDYVLASIPNAQRIYKDTIRRELKCYDVADLIVVPSTHSKNSFIAQGISESKVVVNPYGVNLNDFKPTLKCKAENRYDVILVGAWRYIKGVDLLMDVCQKMHLSLLHVGGVFAGCPLPKDLPGFTHIDAVPEKSLIEYYRQAKIFVLPSRAEGLALVIAQAVSCGLPVVFSTDTGGSDLRSLLKDSSGNMIECDLRCQNLGEMIDMALQQYEKMPDETLRSYVNEEQKYKISWEAYGKRYHQILSQFAENNYSVNM